MLLLDDNNISEAFQEFANIVPGGLYWLDANHKFIGINEFTLKTAHAKIEDVLGKTPFEIHPKEMAEEMIAHHQHVIKTGSLLHCQERVRYWETGETKYFDVMLSPLINSKEEIIGVCGVSTDITELKRLQKETDQQKAKLKKQNEDLQSKDQLKKDFIKNFSHDVRLPINGIVGNTQLLQILSKDNNALKQSAIKVDDGVMSLNKMFDHLYNVMINDELNGEIHNKDFNFTDMVDLEIALTKSSITPNQNVKVDVSLDDKIPKKLHGDVFRVSQILRNILSNSVRYTKSGEIRLIADVLEDAPNTIKIKFTITDTGVGIDTSKKDKIYEYGRRFITSYETNIPGTGIGMYIVKQHVDTLGGKVDYESEINKGTQFFVELNFKKVQPD